MRHCFGLEILDGLAAFLENFVFPEIELAAEIFALALIHKGLVFRRAIVGRDLGSHAHSLSTQEARDSRKNASRAGVIAAWGPPPQLNLMALVSGAQKCGKLGENPYFSGFCGPPNKAPGSSKTVSKTPSGRHKKFLTRRETQ